MAALMVFIGLRYLVELAKVHPNLMCDISGFQVTAKLNYHQFCHMLRSVLDAFGKERVLFGSDGTVFARFVSDKEWVQMLSDLLRGAPRGLAGTETD